jgi:hypothetical protein
VESYRIVACCGAYKFPTLVSALLAFLRPFVGGGGTFGNHRLKYQGLRFCRFHTKIERVRIDWFSQLQTISAVNCGGLGGNPWSKRDQEEPLPPAERFSVDNNWRCNMFKSLDIQKDMEVVGLDGKHVGTVDHLETADRIILSKDDPKAGGRHHLISIEWVDYVDQKVHLNKPSMKATKEWQVAA